LVHNTVAIVIFPITTHFLRPGIYLRFRVITIITRECCVIWRLRRAKPEGRHVGIAVPIAIVVVVIIVAPYGARRICDAITIIIQAVADLECAWINNRIGIVAIPGG
jgi:hypothetical protein